VGVAVILYIYIYIYITKQQSVAVHPASALFIYYLYIQTSALFIICLYRVHSASALFSPNVQTGPFGRFELTAVGVAGHSAHSNLLLLIIINNN